MKRSISARARLAAPLLGLLLAFASPLHAAGKAPPAAAKPAGPVHTGLENLEKQVEEFTLPNGLKFILVERHEAPVFSFETRVNAGGAQEVPGTTGIAHMMEHMAFKGTESVGTKNFAAEAPLLATEEKAWQAVLDERRKGVRADTAMLAVRLTAFKTAQDKAREQVASNEFSSILERNGAQNFNAQTSADWTRYFYSLPSNRLELWSVLEGGRMAFPVFREFYKERDVVFEERRLRIESSAVGRLYEQFIQTSFVAHPYGYGVIGFPSDLHSFTRSQGEAFYKAHYVAKNMAVAVVGDVKQDELKGLATKYWSDISSASAPPELDVKEPQQNAERRVLLEDTAQPYIFIGFHGPAATDPAYPAWDALGDLLGGGDYARLTKLLVKEKKICVGVNAGFGFTGTKYPALFAIVAVPASGQDPLVVEQEVYKALDEIRSTKPFTEEELNGYKVRTRADLIGQCESNQSLATALVAAQIAWGDWHQFFRAAERAQGLKTADLMAPLKDALVRSNRTVAMIVKPQSATPTAEGGH
jgi:predicted Zn-dependent peptidase